MRKTKLSDGECCREREGIRRGGKKRTRTRISMGRRMMIRNLRKNVRYV